MSWRVVGRKESKRSNLEGDLLEGSGLYCLSCCSRYMIYSVAIRRWSGLSRVGICHQWMISKLTLPKQRESFNPYITVFPGPPYRGV